MKRSMFFLIVCILVCMQQVKPIFTVVIDPGHGGKFPGCVGQLGTPEKQINLAVGLKITELLLEQKDVVAIITRTSDQELDDVLLQDLQKRTDNAQKFTADLFVSIHFNSSVNPAVRGFEVYVPMQAAFCKKSYSAAAYIHHSLSQGLEAEFSGTLGNLNTRDRGIRAAKFNVLAKAPCPAVLLELDYLSNPVVEKKLENVDFTDALAQLVVQGIMRYNAQITL